MVKNNKKFEFEKVIYADKFLIKNKNKDRELNEKIEKLREKQKTIKEKLNDFNDYHKGLSIFEIIKTA